MRIICGILDPIDGTKAFIAGLPVFGTLIALWKDGKPLLGVIDQPVIGERWVGAAGRPTTLNGERANAANCDVLSEAVLAATSPEMFQNLRGSVLLAAVGGDTVLSLWRRLLLIRSAFLWPHTLGRRSGTQAVRLCGPDISRHRRERNRNRLVWEPNLPRLRWPNHSRMFSKAPCAGHHHTHPVGHGNSF